MDIDRKVDRLLAAKGMTPVQRQHFWNHILAVGDFLIAFLLISMAFVPFFDKHLSFGVGAEEPLGSGTNTTIPEPSTEGFEIGGINFENINVTFGESTINFNTSYLDATLTPEQVFIPDDIADKATLSGYNYVEAPTGKLVEWTGYTYERVQDGANYNYTEINALLGSAAGDYRGEFVVWDGINQVTYYLGDVVIYEDEYYQVNVSAVYNHGGTPDSNTNSWIPVENNNTNYPQNYFQLGAYSSPLVEYNESIMDVFDYDFVEENTGFNVSWKINVSADYGELVIDYELWFSNKSTTDLVHTFTDIYEVENPSISDTLVFSGDNDSFYATVEKNSSNMTLYDGVNGSQFLSVGLSNGLPDGWSIENTTFTQEYSDSNISFYPCVVKNITCLEFLLELQNQPISNTISFSLNHSLNVFSDGSGGFVFNDVFTAPSNSFGIGSYNNTVFQVFQPVIVDADNDSVYGELSIVDDELQLSVSQDWLNNAVYPIRVDPTFGYESGTETIGALYSYYNNREYLYGQKGTPSNDGTVDNITAYISVADKTIDVQCALYEYDGVDDAGDLIDTTETLSVSSTGNKVFDFSNPKPSVTASTDYFVCIRCAGDYTGGYDSTAIGVDSDGDDAISKYSENGVSFDDPMTGEDDYDPGYNDRAVHLFASYTEGGAANNAPTISNENPSNQSTDISLQPTVNVTVSDADSDTMTCNFYTSSNGVDWTHQQTNSSVSTGTSISYDYTSANSYSTTYYWKVTADDGTDNTTSDIYEFTTESEPLIWQTISNTIGDGTLSNTTSWQTISDSAGDGALSNATIETWQTISSTIGDGTLSNTTTWKTISNTIGDGTLSHSSTWQTISNTIGDGTLSNTTNWQTISNTIGDGTLSNTTNWQTISNTIGDGTVSNTTTWRTISTTIGDGTLANTTVDTWKSISNTIGDGTLSNTTTWSTISDTIGDGSISNTTSWTTISDTVGDGTLSHISTWQTISNTIGDGTLSNTTITTWQTISSTIGDGSITNITSWKTVSNTIGDGTLSHISTWQTISNTIGNGSLSNSTKWKTISNTVGDGILQNISTKPVFTNPHPANNSIITPTDPTNITQTWNITITDNTNSFNYTITCNNGQNTSDNETTNGSKTISLTGLTMDTTYTIWVNATRNNTDSHTNETFYFTIAEGNMTGNYDYTVEGQTISLTPQLQPGVTDYKWKIEDENGNQLSTTEWIDYTDSQTHTSILEFNKTYIVYLFIKNNTLHREIGKTISTTSINGTEGDKDTFRDYTTTEEKENKTTEPKYKNIFDNVPVPIKNFFGNPIIQILTAIAAVTLFLTFLRKKPKKYLYIRQKKKKKKE